MNVSDVITELKELDQVKEWIDYVTTPDTVRLKSLNNLKPNDEYFKKIIYKLIYDKISLLRNSEVKI